VRGLLEETVVLEYMCGDSVAWFWVSVVSALELWLTSTLQLGNA
jgi:hypothetical protein